MISEYDINAYETNQITLYAVQGEADSRTLIFNIIEKSGLRIPTSNAVVVNKMLNITDFTVKLYIIIDNKISFVDGTVIDTENGRVSFVLSKNCTEIAGLAECAIILTRGNEELRIVGLSMQIDKLIIENSNKISICRGTSKTVCVTIFDDDGALYTLKSGDTLILGVKRYINDTDYTIRKTSTSANKEGDGYYFKFVPSDTDKLSSGNYLYEVGLKTSDNDYHIIINLSSFTVVNTLTSGE